MSNSILVSIRIPSEHNLTDVNGAAVRDAIANLFPYDPKFEQIKKAGAEVDITIESDEPAEVIVRATHSSKLTETTAKPAASEEEDESE